MAVRQIWCHVADNIVVINSFQFLGIIDAVYHNPNRGPRPNLKLFFGQVSYIYIYVEYLCCVSFLCTITSVNCRS